MIMKDQIRKEIEKESGIKWDVPDGGCGGSTTTGNIARKIIHDEKLRNIFTRNIKNEKDRKACVHLGEKLSLILSAMSSGRAIHVDKYDALCKDLYKHIISEISWMTIPPTIHKILAHSTEMIVNNGNIGLKNLSEEGMEANNKNLRQFRIRLSRKSNQRANLQDCLKKLWLNSGMSCINR